MLELNKNGLLIVISGPSGAGKGTIVSKLVENNKDFWVSISMTTRKIRPGDIEGVTYNFVSEEKFKEMIEKDDFLEYAIVHSGKSYGTPKANILKKLSEGIDVIVEIDIAGALQIKNKIKDALFIFIMPPSMKELKRRLVERNTEPIDKIMERFKTAYKEINAINNYNYVVVNDELDDAVFKVNSIITSEKCRVDRIESLTLKTMEEEIHEELVDLNV